VRVHPQREASVGVPEVLRDGLHRLARIEQTAGVEVPQRVHAVAALVRHVCLGQNGAVLPDELHAVLGRFGAYPSEHAHVAHTLWTAHTHLMEVWESTPRIAFLSPESGSGKTRALEVTELLVPNPIEAVNVTPAYLFRKVADPAGLPTILFDEIDTVFGPKAKDNEEIRGLLNAGHRRGAVAGRCVVKGKIIETEEIPAYCAVALGGLGGLPDTLLSRSVVVRMRRRAPDENVAPHRRRVHAPECTQLRDRLTAWSVAVVAVVAAPWPTISDGITDRDADVWEPLLAIGRYGWRTLARTRPRRRCRACRGCQAEHTQPRGTAPR
jgi:Protein of unknown function (DUF3631)